jgi:hypothetical protein
MNNSISFSGRINLIDYTHGKVERCFTTTKEQDKLIREAAEQIAPLDSLRIMTDDQIKMFHALLERITDSKISYIENEKVFYRCNHNVSYTDRFIRPWSGIHVNILY